jgi:5-methylcytosine-specific restriction protein A
MTIEDELREAMLVSYRDAYAQLGYRAARFKQSIDRNGALATAKRMLTPRTKLQRAGLDRLIEANRPDLSFEYVVVQPRFRKLFTEAEIAEAKRRLAEFRARAREVKRRRDNIYPDELELGRTYNEGAKRQVRVNAYERDPRARRACIEYHGCRCTVCDLEFEQLYGAIGRGFIHVHHLRPLAASGQAETVNPVRDLVPVCPNCHAMLHRGDRLLGIEELRQIVVHQATAHSVGILRSDMPAARSGNREGGGRHAPKGANRTR